MPFHLPGTTPPTGRASSASNRKWRIFYSYLPDWILTIIVWGLFYLLDKVDGFRQVFSVTDERLAHEYTLHERVPVWLLAVTCGLVPGLVIVLTGLVYRRSFWDAHAGVLGFILSLGLSVTLTNIMKITVGRPRPDLFGRCQLPSDLTSNPLHGLTSWRVCTRTDLLKDGFRSFPSGHSSFAWAGMWYLILFGAAKMRISNRKGYTWKSWLLVAPLCCAILIAISRLMDYRHNPTDVIAGGILGVLVAWYGYRQYYPPIDAPQSYKPYSPRIPKEAETIPTHRQETEHSSFIPSALAQPHLQGHSHDEVYKQTSGSGSDHHSTQDPYIQHPGQQAQLLAVQNNSRPGGNAMLGANGHGYPPVTAINTGANPYGSDPYAVPAGRNTATEVHSEDLETVQRDRT